ncbi:MAG: hypothetical protein K6T90_13425 [Leptolyngbyaceae cyanobacterium HOT.MB2.61]|nr:hypothetical protein [Leptolyngbyaceae cyanobacterium HOT.MB2.61]
MTQHVGIWAASVEFQTYTIARAATSCSCPVFVITAPKDKIAHFGHSLYYDKLKKLPHVKVLNSWDGLHLDWLYIQISSDLPRGELAEAVKHSRHIGLFSSCGKTSFSKTLLSQVKEVIKYFPVTLKAERVFLADGFYPTDLYSIWAKRYLMGIDVHSNFLDNPDLLLKMFAFEWKPEVTRKYRLNFIGNRKPQFRTELINTIKSYLISQNLWNSSEYLWIEYGDEPGEKRGVPPAEFIHYLTESDFTLCPPGYAKLTHRVIEALVRGSIPVLHTEELELYDSHLQDQINCLAVHHSNWVKAIDQLIHMPESKIVQIRSSILAMKEDILSNEAFSRKLGTKMGLVYEP